MSSQMIFTAISSLLSLLGICYLIFWRYRSYSVDKFRQDMFELRDELFDFADDGGIEFNHLAYGVLRSTINGHIHFAEQFSVWSGIFLWLFTKKDDYNAMRSFDEVWTEATKRLDDQTKERLGAFRKRMDKITFRHFLTSAPEFFLFLPLVVVALFVFLIAKAGLSVFSNRQQILEAWLKLRSRINAKIDNTAFVYGNQATT